MFNNRYTANKKRTIWDHKTVTPQAQEVLRKQNIRKQKY